MPSMRSEIDKMLSVMPDSEQQLAFEVVKRLFLAWGGTPQDMEFSVTYKTATNAIRDIMAEKRITQAKLAETMGYSSQSGVRSRLDSKISCDLLIQMLDCLDYEVVVQPKTSGKRKEGSIVLEPSGLPDGRGKKQKKAENGEAPAEE